MIPLSLSRTEQSLFIGIINFYWLIVLITRILAGRIRFDIQALAIIGVSLSKIILVVAATLCFATFVEWVARRRSIDLSSRVYRSVRFATIVAGMFLAFIGIEVTAAIWLGTEHEIDSISFVTVLVTPAALLLLFWAVRTRTRFLSVAFGIMIAAPWILRFEIVDQKWYEVLEHTRPVKTIAESPISIISMDEWPGNEDFRQLLGLVKNSDPAVVCVLFPLYRYNWATAETSMYSILPPDQTVYGVRMGWGGNALLHGIRPSISFGGGTLTQRNEISEGFAVHRALLPKLARGVVTGILPGPPLSGVYDWGSEFVPVINRNKEVPFEEESLDASVITLAKYLGAKAPLYPIWNRSFWASYIVRILGRDIPVDSWGFALINHPTREIPVSRRSSQNSTSGFHRLSYYRNTGRADSTGDPLEPTVMLEDREVRRGLLYTGSLDSRGAFIPSDGTDHIDELSGRIVLMSLRQHHLGPLQESDVVGYSYAAILQSLLEGDFIVPLNEGWFLLFTLLTASFVLLCFRRFPATKAVSFILFGAIVLVITLIALFAVFQAMISPLPILGPTGVALLFMFPVEVNRERRRMLNERATLAAELRAAHDMQMSLMPKEDPMIEGFDVAACCYPAGEVGGDFYDYVWLDERKTKLGLAVADVSGKAMKAAMTAVLTSGMLYSEVQKSDSPREVLRRINRPLYLRSDKRVFTAMSFAVIDLKSKLMTYSCAGQTPVILVRNGKTQELLIQGVRLPLGVKEDLEYKELKIKLRAGDLLMFSTDGIAEAMNSRQEIYGFDRLQRALERWYDLPAAAIRDRLLKEVQEYVGGAPQHDDMTIVVVKVAQ